VHLDLDDAVALAGFRRARPFNVKLKPPPCKAARLDSGRPEPVSRIGAEGAG